MKFELIIKCTGGNFDSKIGAQSCHLTAHLSELNEFIQKNQNSMLLMRVVIQVEFRCKQGGSWNDLYWVETGMGEWTRYEYGFGYARLRTLCSMERTENCGGGRIH